MNVDKFNNVNVYREEINVLYGREHMYDLIYFYTKISICRRHLDWFLIDTIAARGVESNVRCVIRDSDVRCEMCRVCEVYSIIVTPIAR